jgi:hypothetical protein
LIDGGYSRDGSIYRAEEYAACQYVADRADGAVQALLIGETLWPAPASEVGAKDDEGGEPRDERKEVPAMRLASHHTRQVLTRLARAGRLDARALPPLRAALQVTSFEERVGGSLTSVIEVLGWRAMRPAWSRWGGSWR